MPMNTIDLPVANVELSHVEGYSPYEASYTVTSDRTALGGPELIVFTDDHDLARKVIWELTSPKPSSDNQIADHEQRALICLDGRRVAFRQVDWIWTERTNTFSKRGSWSSEHLVEFGALQIVLPDDQGQLPGEGDRPSTCMCCPDLSLPNWERYAQPFWPADATWHTGEPPHLSEQDGLLVAADAYNDGDHQGRVEMLPARRLADGRVQILAPPVLADWTTTGAIHELVDPDEFSRWTRLSDEFTPGPDAHMCWELRHDSGHHDAAVRIKAALSDDKGWRQPPTDTAAP